MINVEKIDALLTRPNTRPNMATAASTAAMQLASSATSVLTKMRRPVPGVFSAATALPFSSFQSATHTSTPYSTSVSASLCPMPWAAPVTTTAPDGKRFITLPPASGFECDADE